MDGVTRPDVERLLRELGPQALGAVARGCGEFADAEDAVQQALLSAAQQWPGELPDEPLSWLITVASRRLVDEYRRTDARRRREDLAASLSIDRLSIHQQETAPAADDSLVLLLLCCDDTLSPTLSIPLTLRAVAGLTTRQIAAAYLVPEATMAQRISRAKAKLRGRRFQLPTDLAARLRSVGRVLYLLSTRATRPRADRTWRGPIFRARRSGWPACCTAKPRTTPRRRVCSR